MSSYNNAKYIMATLESLHQQTYPNVEIIIVDDCSTDDSVAIIEKWMSTCNIPCQFIRHEQNLGVCRVANDMIDNAKGKYISIIASDDIMRPEKTSIQVKLLEGLPSKVGVVYADAYIINEFGEKYFSKFIQWHRQFFAIPQGNIFEDLLAGNYIPFMTALFRRECFDTCGRFDESLIYEDYDMLLKIAKNYEFIFSNYHGADYRIHGNNLHKKLKSLKGAENNFNIFAKHIGISNEIDLKIRAELLLYLDYMVAVNAPDLNVYLLKFNKLFSDDNLINIAVRYNISYLNLKRAKRIIGFGKRLISIG